MIEYMYVYKHVSMQISEWKLTSSFLPVALELWVEKFVIKTAEFFSF